MKKIFLLIGAVAMITLSYGCGNDNKKNRGNAGQPCESESDCSGICMNLSCRNSDKELTLCVDKQSGSSCPVDYEEVTERTTRVKYCLPKSAGERCN